MFFHIFADFLLVVLSVVEKRVLKPTTIIYICLFLLAILSIFTSCILQLDGLVYTHLDCYVSLADRPFYLYVMYLSVSGNFLLSKVYFMCYLCCHLCFVLINVCISFNIFLFSICLYYYI